MNRYSDKTILITGAGDIAQATARRLLSEGGYVALTDFPKALWRTPSSPLFRKDGIHPAC